MRGPWAELAVAATGASLLSIAAFVPAPAAPAPANATVPCNGEPANTAALGVSFLLAAALLCACRLAPGPRITVASFCVGWNVGGLAAVVTSPCPSTGATVAAIAGLTTALVCAVANCAQVVDERRELSRDTRETRGGGDAGDAGDAL